MGSRATEAPLLFTQLPDLQHAVRNRQRTPIGTIVLLVRRQRLIHAHLHAPTPVRGPPGGAVIHAVDYHANVRET
jgi:hypothetical protein